MAFNLTTLEKKAVSKVLLDIVNADGRVTVGEVKYFEQLRDVLGITNEELNEAKYMSVAGSLAVIKEMLPHEKQALAIMMHQMITADGKVDDEELEVFITVCALSEIPLPEEAEK